jgi:hypothetical protein
MQIQLDYGCEQFFPNGSRAPQAVQLPRYSFLKIDEYHEVSLASLRPYLDEDGDQFKIRSKKKGGLGDLKDYLWKKENQRVKEQKKLRESLSTQTLAPLVEKNLQPTVELDALPELSSRKEPESTEKKDNNKISAVEVGVQTSCLEANLHIERLEKLVGELSLIVKAKSTDGVVKRAATTSEDSWEILPDEKNIGVLRDFVRWASLDARINHLTWEERLDEYCRQKEDESFM